MPGAFKNCDGKTVPLCWGHDHNNPDRVLGHAMLESRDGDIYAYGKFNDTESGRTARELVKNGDICSLSIYANQLKEHAGHVAHGVIREVSLVLAGANPGAFIDTVIAHGDGMPEEAIIYNVSEDLDVIEHEDSTENEMGNDEKMAESKKEPATSGKTLAEVFDTLTDEQKNAVYAILGFAMEENDEEDDDDNKEDDVVKHNIFDADSLNTEERLSHAEEEGIINLAKSSSVGSLQAAIDIACENDDHLAHSFDDIDTLFPDYRDVKPGAPDILSNDQGWITAVMNGAHKSPISRIRTRQVDIRSLENLRGKGFQKGKQKALAGNAKLLKRTTDPQTVYRKDALYRDDIVDITDFDVVEYQYGIMKMNLNEELATAIMIGDGRDDGDDAKISEEHIRSIWHDDDLYTIHATVDTAAMKTELQGTNTGVNFGENYIYAEAIVQSALYARENFKGSGKPDFYCTPHLLNVMLLARDLNGRRIYPDVSDLAKALNVGTIYTCEQFDGKTRTTTDGKTKKLLGIFVNMSDYQIGSTKGGEITRFNQFDIDFNQEKYLIETRVSGALIKPYAAIALEEDQTTA